MGHSASESVMDVADDEYDSLLSSDADQDLELIRIADRVEEEEMAETWLNAAVDEAETMETRVLPIVDETASNKPSDVKEASPPEHPVESNPQTSTQFAVAKSLAPAGQSTSVPSPYEIVLGDQEYHSEDDYGDQDYYLEEYYFENDEDYRRMFRNDVYLDSLHTVALRCRRLAVNGEAKWFNVTECRIRAVRQRGDGYVYDGCPECEKKLDEGVRQCENPWAKHRIPREVLQRHLFFKVHVDVVDRHGFVLEMYLPDKMLEKLVPNFDAGNLLINDEDGNAVERTQDEQKALLETKLRMDRRLTMTVLAKRTEYNTISYTVQRVEILEPVVFPAHTPRTPKKEKAKLLNRPGHTVGSDLPKPSSQSRAPSPVKASTSALEVESPKVAAAETSRGVKRAHGVSNVVTSAKTSTKVSPKGVETRSSMRKNPLVDIEEKDETADEEDDAATSSDDDTESSADENEQSSISSEGRGSLKDFIVSDDDMDVTEDRVRDKKKRKMSGDAGPKFKIGASVFAKWKDDGNYYFGKVRACRKSNSDRTSVEWYDGDGAEVKEADIVRLEDIVKPHHQVTFMGAKSDECGQITKFVGVGKEMKVDIHIAEKVSRKEPYPAKILLEISLDRLRFSQQEVQKARRFQSY